MPLLVVAGALTRKDGRVLMAQRPEGKHHGGLWEFPGGKIEPGETPRTALARELGEELGIVIDPAAFEPIAFAESVRPNPMVLLLYRCREWRGEPMALDAAAIRWVAVESLDELAMPPADRVLVATLADSQR